MTKAKRSVRVFYNSPGDKEVLNQSMALVEGKSGFERR